MMRYERGEKRGVPASLRTYQRAAILIDVRIIRKERDTGRGSHKEEKPTLCRLSTYLGGVDNHLNAWRKQQELPLR